MAIRLSNSWAQRRLEQFDAAWNAFGVSAFLSGDEQLKTDPPVKPDMQENGARSPAGKGDMRESRSARSFGDGAKNSFPESERQNTRTRRHTSASKNRAYVAPVVVSAALGVLLLFVAATSGV